MTFQAIAIIGQSCVLPGALNPEELWQNIVAGKNLVSDADTGSWGKNISEFLEPATGKNIPVDKSWHSRGGHVRGFESVFDGSQFDFDQESLKTLDPLFQWVLHTGLTALTEAQQKKKSKKTGVIIGNLSYPTRGMNEFAQAVWCKDLKANAKATAKANALNKYMSGFPAHLLSTSLGLSGPAYCIDAACASSLYAIKLACDELNHGNVDLMLAGGVNAIDDLFLHVGFTSLGALSKSGQSRPFHREADGLIPATGAAMIALKRLSDAEADGDKILGVIRGVGLSNDGSAGGLLSPSADAQTIAMEKAYAMSGLSPKDISLIECHATGTQVGDGIELESLGNLYKDQKNISIGSLKSNMGHLVTAAGVAGVIKMLGAIKHSTKPPTINASNPLPSIENSPFRLCTEASPWTDDVKRAAVSAFGFGGNNAHLLLEEYKGVKKAAKFKAQKLSPIAIVSIATKVGSLDSESEFAAAFLENRSQIEMGQVRQESIELDCLETGFPPKDLEEVHPQQLVMMEVTKQALEKFKAVEKNRMSVFVGMGTDTEATRYYSRLQLPAQQRDGMVAALNGIRTLGCMPNVVANRLNVQHNFTGPSYTFSSEELSGLCAINAARVALSENDVDAVLVGAVDLSCDDVSTQSANLVFKQESKKVPADAALALVFKRLEDAKADGDTIYAVIDTEQSENGHLKLDTDQTTKVFGHSHAASGLVQVAAAALSIYHDALPGKSKAVPAGITEDTLKIKVETTSFSGLSQTLLLSSDVAQKKTSFLENQGLKLYTFSGRDKSQVIVNLDRDHQSTADGETKLAIVASSSEEFEKRKAQALQLLRSGHQVKNNVLMIGIFFAEKAQSGKLAFTFPSSAGSYAGMGRELLLAYPELLTLFQERVGKIEAVKSAADWIYDQYRDESSVSLYEKLKGALFLTQIHAHFTQDLLGLNPDAYIGFSAGETAALFASRAWDDLKEYYQDVEDCGIWTKHLAGDFKVLESFWKEVPKAERVWRNYGVAAPLEVVQAALENEPLVHLATINSASESSICGQEAALKRVIAKIGETKCKPIHYDLVHHCPEFAPFKDAWVQLTTRKITNKEARFYGSGNDKKIFAAKSKGIAEALLVMAEETVDFPAIIESAYADGVRIFIEHGARSSCSSYIGQILGDRDHLTVSLDHFGNKSLQKTFESLAKLYVNGIKFDLETLNLQKNENQTTTEEKPKLIKKFPAHFGPVNLPALEKQPQGQTMSKATDLPKSLPLYFHEAEMREAAPVPAPAPTPAVAPVSTIAAAAASVVTPVPTPETPTTNFAVNMARHHREFIKKQAELQANFMEMNQRILTAFATGQSLNPHQSTPVSIPAAPDPMVPAPVAPVTPVIAKTEPTAVVTPTSTSKQPEPIGPSFTREQLEIHADGKISEIFGDLFKQQDQYDVQVRMPTYPMLLADRVTGIDAVPGELKTGTVWTETDITHDAWYIHQGHIPPGVMIESGQADLFLISYMGIDFKNKGDRAYRLLGCEVTYMDELARPGDTLKYDIHVDGHAIDGDIHLFFFHYDCYVGDRHVLRVTNGQAGFFNKKELSESKGVLWTPADAKLISNPRLDAELANCTKTSFSKSDLLAFAAGDLTTCFGDEFKYASTHTRTPTIPSGNMLLLDEVTHFEKSGGPWEQGYLRATRKINPDDWFFDGHFKNDPCMPGTLMTDMAFQGISIYMAALGFTLKKDGYTFAPMVGEAVPLSCRGQVLPTSNELVLEVYVREIIGGDQPTMICDILSTVDGLKALHAENINLRLMPDYPNGPRAALPELEKTKLSQNVALVDGIPCDEKQSSDCAWGKPSEVFGSKFEKFDHGRRLARLPGDPYMFISRITEIDGPYCGMQKGTSLIAEWDVPNDSIFFQENGNPTLPYCVIQEAVLQPCGWLGCYLGCPLEYDMELFFRNLDGTLNMHMECIPNGSTIRTHVKNTTIAKSGGTIIVSFDVEAFIGDQKLLDMNTVFGYFSGQSLEVQIGLANEGDEVKLLTQASDYQMDMLSRPEKFCGKSLRLPGKKLLMYDGITGFWPEAGKAKLGIIRGEKRVETTEWFFKAHFFQDPVQPGSLGLEPMLQLLQFYMLEKGLGDTFKAPRFQPIALGKAIKWRYRGQIIPKNKLIQSVIEITDVTIDTENNEVTVTGDASIWCDGLKIYDAKNVAMRIVEGGHDHATYFSREKLEEHASGKLEAVFGSEFSSIDSNKLRARLPASPFLLMDRVSHVDDKELSFDFKLAEDQFYMTNSRLSPALLFEAPGQASIFFCSRNRGDFKRANRVYRVLSLEGIQFYAELPKAGDELKYKIILRGKTDVGESSFYFFRYECWNNGKLIGEVDKAMAGLLLKSELDKAKGVTWTDPEAKSFDVAAATTTYFDKESLEIFADGNPLAIDQVTEFNPQTGYLKAVRQITPTDWFFQAHFKNDPCMPAALIGEGCFQSLSFYLYALGLKIDEKHFAPALNKAFAYQGGGQVTPENSHLSFEVFVQELDLGSKPGIQAQIKVTVDDQLLVLSTALALELL